MTTTEAIKYLGREDLSRGSFYALVRDWNIRSTKVKGAHVFKQSDLDLYEKHRRLSYQDKWRSDKQLQAQARLHALLAAQDKFSA